jgi:hypothetical protein
VTGLFANEEFIFLTDTTPRSISWEIRTGMGVGNGGSVYASGTASTTSWTPTGRLIFAGVEYSALAQLATPVVLHEGVTYWINVLPEIGVAGGPVVGGPWESSIDGGGDNHYGPANVLNASLFIGQYFRYPDYTATTDIGSFSGFSFGVLGKLEPDCSTATATPNVLWPPNHTLQTITLGGVTDPNGGSVTYTVTGVTQDEPVLGPDSGDTSPDAATGTAPSTVQVRAERSGEGDGRVYRIAFTATAAGGASCSGVVTVGVPLSQSGTPALDSAPPSYDSFGQ